MQVKLPQLCITRFSWWQGWWYIPSRRACTHKHRCTHMLVGSLFGISVLQSLVREDSVKSLSILIKKGRACPWITSSPLRRVPGGVCWEGECLYPQFSPEVDKLLTVLRSEILFPALLRGTKFISRQMRLKEVERKITSVKDKSLMLSIMCYFENRVV